MSDQRLPDEAIAYYDAGRERERLLAGASRIEFARTQDILRRVLPSPPARMLDIGGGPGGYAAWLACEGYDVQLLDAVALHVEQAADAASRQPEHPFAAMQGDARVLPMENQSADAALLLGPLYHLTERADRLQALREARRVLRPGGVVAVAAISRFTSLLDGLWNGFLDDPAFAPIVERDLRDGQHRNPTNQPGYFTTAYFHHPDELADEISAAGLELESVRAVEGPAWLLPNLDHWWEDDTRRERLLTYLAAVEREPSLVGVSAHMLAIAVRQKEK
ncbi:MAG TPA: methyltransferase domain-containing protein [Thermomicrobiales bacterium]|nr:methyltransferase domain-containing protein [Thermomicrobiales bacterium]